MDSRTVFILTPFGMKTQLAVNMNSTLMSFLRVVSTIADMDIKSIQLGNRIYSREVYEKTLSELGIAPNMEIKLLANS